MDDFNGDVGFRERLPPFDGDNVEQPFSQIVRFEAVSGFSGYF